MWCWRRMEKVSWADHVRNKEVRPWAEEYPTWNKKTEGQLDWSHLTTKLPSKTSYWRKDKGGDRSDKEDVRSYWMTLRTGEDTVIWRRKL
jgi:hypothetical protein